MNTPNYNFPTTKADESLALNKYYFVCDHAGHFLKNEI